MARPPNPVELSLRRINRVVDMVEANLSENLVLDDLARAAAFSRFHFHRVFHEHYGETPKEYVQRRRLELGAWLLHYSTGSIARVAQRCGFATADGFARAFRRRFGMSPLDWRTDGFGQRLLRHLPPESMENPDAWQVRIERLTERRVAYHRQMGPYGLNTGRQWENVTTWMGTWQLHGATRYGMGLDDPVITPPEQCRYDICVELPADFAVNPRTPVKVIPAGLYAVLRYEGPPTGSSQAWLWLMEKWLPASGYQMEKMFHFERYTAGTPNPDVDRQNCDLCVALAIEPSLIAPQFNCQPR